MGKKKGRPKKEIARTFGYRLRLSMGELYALEYIQEISGKARRKSSGMEFEISIIKPPKRQK